LLLPFSRRHVVLDKEWFGGETINGRYVAVPKDVPSRDMTYDPHCRRKFNST
ncbi:unnamed protein product, partial [Rotaria sp. Silwood2]